MIHWEYSKRYTTEKWCASPCDWIRMKVSRHGKKATKWFGRVLVYVPERRRWNDYQPCEAAIFCCSFPSAESAKAACEQSLMEFSAEIGQLRDHP